MLSSVSTHGGFAADNAFTADVVRSSNSSTRNGSKHTCESRSTSPGSMTPPVSIAGEDLAESVASLLGTISRGHIDAAPLFVRNTFIDAPISRPSSLEGFLDERLAQSCPVTRMPTADGLALPPGFEDFLESIGNIEEPLVGTDNANDAISLVIKNTFLEAPVGRHASLEGFYQERQVHSCPASRPLSFDDVCAPPGLETVLEDSEDTSAANPSCDGAVYTRPAPVKLPLKSPCGADVYWPSGSEFGRPGSYTFDLSSAVTPFADEGPMAPGVFATESPETPPLCWWAPGLLGGVEMSRIVTPPPPPSELAPIFDSHFETPPPSSAPILRLSDALDVPEIGTPACPTVGSACHHLGTCKPCAFLHKQGCNNGAECSFCHLCPPGEKKKRKVEKREQRRAMNNMEVTMFGASLPAR